MFSFGFILASVMLVACINGQDISSTQCNCDDDIISTLVDIECRLKQVLDKCVSADTSFEKEPTICASTTSQTSGPTTTYSPTSSTTTTSLSTSSTTTTSQPASSSTTSSPRNCTGDWKPFGQSCYLITETIVNFATAVARCKSLGGYLAEIENGSENSYLQTIVKLSSEYYIGLNDINEEDTFSWFGTNRLLSETGYSNWDVDEPDNYMYTSYGGDEDCVTMFGSGYWNDVSCTDNHGYICEIKN